MSRMHTAPRLLAIAVITAGSLALAACSRPTPVGGPADTEAGGAGEGESVAPPPYYEDDSGSARLQPGDEGYPPPAPAAEYVPEGYPGPGEAPVDGAEEGEMETGDEAGEEGEEGEASEDEG